MNKFNIGDIVEIECFTLDVVINKKGEVVEIVKLTDPTGKYEIEYGVRINENDLGIFMVSEQDLRLIMKVGAVND